MQNGIGTGFAIHISYSNACNFVIWFASCMHTLALRTRTNKEVKNGCRRANFTRMHFQMQCMRIAYYEWKPRKFSRRAHGNGFSFVSSSFEFQADCVYHIPKCKVVLLWKMNERMNGRICF